MPLRNHYNRDTCLDIMKDLLLFLLRSCYYILGIIFMGVLWDYDFTLYRTAILASDQLMYSRGLLSLIESLSCNIVKTNLNILVYMYKDTYRPHSHKTAKALNFSRSTPHTVTLKAPVVLLCNTSYRLLTILIKLA